MKKRGACVTIISVVMAMMITGMVGCAQEATPRPTPTATPTVAPVSFEGKTITVIVPVGPGGGTDIMGRIYAKYLTKYLPGNPTMVVRNIPGAESTIGTNYFYTQKPDGLTLLVGTASAALVELLGRKALKFSHRELTAIVGSTGSTVYYVRPGLINRPEDIVKAKGIVYAGAGQGAMTFATAVEIVGFAVDKAIMGGIYGSTAEMRRAFLAGEINASNDTNVGYATGVKPLVEKGEAKLLFQSGGLDEKGNIIRHPALPDIMTIKELYEKLYGKPPSGMAYEAYRALLASLESLKTVLFLPPKTPANIAGAYFDAAAKMTKDPEFLKLTVPMTGEGAEWIAGEAFNTMFQKEFGMKPEVSDWLRNLMSTKYGMVLD